jgi:uncharacterized Zn finger protein
MICPHCGFDVTKDKKTKKYVSDLVVRCRNCGFRSELIKTKKEVPKVVQPEKPKSTSTGDFIQ